MQRLLPLFLFLLVSACESTPTNSSSFEPDPVMNDLAVYALSFSGTPYKYGGTSPESGFDCSGFVGYVFKNSLGKQLPRSAEQISRVGERQKEEWLKPGDLVFYNTMNRNYSHVGIYLGRGQFIHSPSRGKSVSVVNMNEPYWRQRYNGARRIRP